MDDLIFSSAAKLARAIREKRVSSLEVVEAHLRRIEEVNPKLNAVVQLTEASARAEARAADAALAKGKAIGPLHGVPMTIKDALETAGVVSTGGTLGRISHVPTGDATVVRRMREAGAILLGKTNLPEASMAFESDNLVYGRTNNPYDLSRTPGGSTGGESAIIAAGGSPMGLGSDAGGSIRVPCHFCGIAGIKPTTGRAPRTGHWPRFNGLLDSWTQVGPMARFVEDLAFTLPVISGVDWHDPHVAPMPLGDPKDVNLKTLRVAFFWDNGVLPPSAETANIIKAAARRLADAVLAVEEARPQGIEECQEIVLAIWQADGGAGVRAALRAAGTRKMHDFIQRAFALKDVRPMSAAKLGGWLVRLDEFRGRMLSFMERYDAILCPVSAYPAFAHGTTFDRDKFAAFTYTQTFNLTGWPAAVVRGGTSKEGLPIGVQIAARPWREDVALALIGYLEKTLGGWQRPPL